MKETAPYHRHYPKDHIAETFGMDFQTIGMYDILRDICWTEGSIPSQPVAIAKLLKVNTRVFLGAWGDMQHLFDLTKDRITHHGIETERTRLSTMTDARAEAGKKGADRKWASQKKQIAKPENLDGKGDGKPMANGMAKDSISVLSSQFSVCSLSSTEDKQPPNPLSVLGADAQREWLKTAGWAGVKKATPAQVQSVMDVAEESLEPIEDLRSLYMIRARLWWFEEFWDGYWRKVDKSGARVAYMEHVPSLALHDRVVAAVEIQSPAMMRREEERRPHAATWINHSRWDDEQGELTESAIA